MSRKEVDGVPVRDTGGGWLVCCRPSDVQTLVRKYMDAGLLGDANALFEAHFVALSKRSKVRQAASAAYDALSPHEKRLLDGGC